jgi:superfamily I DNA/RNA helicase
MNYEPDPSDLLKSKANFDLVPARFRCELGLPEGDAKDLREAAKAVRQEYRKCRKWEQLQCERVDVIAERGRGTVCVIHVGKKIEFDWTWEGAIAFRPVTVKPDETLSTFDLEHENFGNENAWQGEVLWVDELNGCLFVSIEDPEAFPTKGTFLVKPFEFLAVLDAVYHDEQFETAQRALPSRLAAASGGVHPRTASRPRGGLSQLDDWWQHSWSALWGPPGTGKTWTTGQQVAAALADPSERILIVSTTNRATDEVAISLGKAAREGGIIDPDSGKILRIGKGANLPDFSAANLDTMLRGTEAEILSQISQLNQRIKETTDTEQKAFLRKELVKLRNQTDRGLRMMIDPDIRAVVATAFKAVSSLKNETIASIIAAQAAPFTTILIDEAGLLSRAAISALSLLASRRVVLVGDSKQLAPISQVSRLLPARQQRWLASSGLTHLDELKNTPAAVHVLREQRRMHTDVCEVVSKYQYNGALTTAVETQNRESVVPKHLGDFSRVIWYVLDEDAPDLQSIRAERGPGNRSWIREISLHVLEKLLSDQEFRQSKGLFISPFRAQAQLVADRLAENQITNWEASTVHRQQGSEREVVVFDTVNASCNTWPIEEWKRLINVGLSRAKEAVILIASRHEMDEPYLRPLRDQLKPAVLSESDGLLTWKEVTVEQTQGTEDSTKTPTSMGGQIADRRRMKPILTREQERLANLNLDGKPRLVRGVAGSGKSIVLCHWLVKTIERFDKDPTARVWAVYANKTLHQLLTQSIETAWQEMHRGSLFETPELPWHKIELFHVREILQDLLKDADLSIDSFDFDYDRAAEEFLRLRAPAAIEPRCRALFIDEAQDMGPSTLRLLLSLVEPTNATDRNSRAAHIFYDNAQNIYRRKTPTWSDFGLDMRGRSTILRESFRSTRPILNLAVNVLNRLSPKRFREDLKELIELGLIESSPSRDSERLIVNYCDVEGPNPICRFSTTREEEIQIIGEHLKHLIVTEEIEAKEICLLYIGEDTAQRLLTTLSPQLREIGVELSWQRSQSIQRRPNTLLLTTPHSFKGFEAEIIVIPSVDQYVTNSGEILANALYVAMTRARSLLAIYGIDGGSPESQQLTRTIRTCIDELETGPLGGIQCSEIG